jgi:putative transposase
MLKAYKFRIYPNKNQIGHLNRAFGCVRYMYNKGLEERIQTYKETKKGLTYFDQCSASGILKREQAEHDWLRVPTVQSLRGSLLNLDRAFTNFFKGQSKFPKFKRKSGHESIQHLQGVRVHFDQKKVWIPRLRYVSAVFNRTFEGKVKTCTVSRTPAGKFYISILVDDGKDLPIKSPIEDSTTVGIDLGIKDFAILSTGEKIPNPKFLRKNLERLKVLQIRASHKQKGSNNRKKANLKVAKLHELITNQRKDFLHKISFKIVSENQTIVLETLNVKGLLRNHCLAQAISDVSWGEFVRQLTYKAEWKGKNVIRIGMFEPSSKTCSVCGTTNPDLTLKDRSWTCNGCQTLHDRDENAATNIKQFGLLQHKLGNDSNVILKSGQEMPVEPCGGVVLCCQKEPKSSKGSKTNLRSGKSSSPHEGKS